MLLPINGRKRRSLLRIQAPQKVIIVNGQWASILLTPLGRCKAHSSTQDVWNLWLFLKVEYSCTKYEYLDKIYIHIQNRVSRLLELLQYNYYRDEAEDWMNELIDLSQKTNLFFQHGGSRYWKLLAIMFIVDHKSRALISSKVIMEVNLATPCLLRLFLGC